jgi:hypothetical protein
MSIGRIQLNFKMPFKQFYTLPMTDMPVFGLQGIAMNVSSVNGIGNHLNRFSNRHGGFAHVTDHLFGCLRALGIGTHRPYGREYDQTRKFHGK